MWTYKQTGHLITPDGVPASHTWYSGHAEHANKPEDEGLKGLGPLPRGTYALGNIVTNSSMGPFAIHLIPDAATRAHITELGRDPDSFFAHAGNRQRDHSASAGCLVCMDGVAPVQNLAYGTDRVIRCVSGLPDAPVLPIT